MYAMQYELTLPADYDMEIIRKRVRDRGNRTDGFPGLGIKAYLIRERGVDDRRSTSTRPFYLWRESAGMNRFLWGGGGFAGIVTDFGRPPVRHWTGVEHLPGPDFAISPVAATKHTEPIPALTDPTEPVAAARERLREQAELPACDRRRSRSIRGGGSWCTSPCGRKSRLQLPGFDTRCCTSRAVASNDQVDDQRMSPDRRADHLGARFGGHAVEQSGREQPGRDRYPAGSPLRNRLRQGGSRGRAVSDADFGVESRGQPQRCPAHIGKSKRIRRPGRREHDAIAAPITSLDQPAMHRRHHGPRRTERRSKCRVGTVSELRGHVHADVIPGSKKRRQDDDRPGKLSEHVGNGGPAHIREGKLHPNPAQPRTHRIDEFADNHRTRRIASPMRNDHQTHRTDRPAAPDRPARSSRFAFANKQLVVCLLERRVRVVMRRAPVRLPGGSRA